MGVLHGALLINKPKGLTSHDVVHKVRKVFGIKEVGHAGTLDPLAQGVLVILVGEATKISQFISSESKDYLADLDFGYTTDTLDSEGQVTSRTKQEDVLSQEKVQTAVAKLVGPLNLEVPIYSAVKVKGKKLYEYARQGESIPLPCRKMHFYKAEIRSSEPKKAQVFLSCEKGAYVRSWIQQLGEDLKVGATMTGLIRQRSGDFELKNTTNLQSLEESCLELEFEEFLEEVREGAAFVSLEKCLKGRFYRLSGFEARLMQNGQVPKSLNKRLNPAINSCRQSQKDEVLRVFKNENGQDKLLALLEIKAQKPKPKILRVFKENY